MLFVISGGFSSVRRTHPPLFLPQVNRRRARGVVDADISELEDKIAALETEIAGAATEYGRLQKLVQGKEVAESQLEEKMERWIYLNELAEQMNDIKRKEIINQMLGQSYKEKEEHKKKVNELMERLQ